MIPTPSKSTSKGQRHRARYNRFLRIHQCPFCRNKKLFTSKGLRHHKCKENPLTIPAQISAEQYAAIINGAYKIKRSKLPKSKA